MERSVAQLREHTERLREAGHRLLKPIGVNSQFWYNVHKGILFVSTYDRATPQNSFSRRLDRQDREPCDVVLQERALPAPHDLLRVWMSRFV